MPLIRLLALMLFALAPACTTAPAEAIQSPVYYVMRHLHTPEGERDPDLTSEGRRHAGMLADRLAGGRLAAIYVSHFKRTQQSAEPLASRLGLTPIVYDPADTAALVARVRSGPSPALIVGHSNTVPDIVEQLGGTRPGPLSHPDFGDLWRVGPSGDTLRTRIDAP